MMLALKGLEKALRERKHKREYAKINCCVCSKQLRGKD